MAIVENLQYDQSRRDFLGIDYLFSRRRSNRGQPPRKPYSEPSSPQGEPPDFWNWFNRKVNRREVLGLGVLVVTLGGGGFIAHKLRWLFPTLPDHEFREDWLRLSPKERIKRLEFKQYPKFSDFDSTDEMIRASAQYYCSIVGCNFEDMLNRVSLVDTQRIIEEVEFDNERKLTDEEKRHYGEETVEMFSVKRGLILINKAHLNRETDKFIVQRGSGKELEGIDTSAVMLKSTLFHAYTHANAERKGFSFEPITVLSQVPTIFDRLDEGFVFFGQRQNGVKVSLHGGNEAITEYISVAIGQDTGLMVSGSAYTSGVRLVEILNIRAGITLEEFTSYYLGLKPKKELFRRWGALKNPQQPDENAALAALLTIGLRVDHPQDMTQEQAITRINELLRP